MYVYGYVCVYTCVCCVYTDLKKIYFTKHFTGCGEEDGYQAVHLFPRNTNDFQLILRDLDIGAC